MRTWERALGNTPKLFLKHLFIILKITPKGKQITLTFIPFRKCVNCAYVVPEQIQQQCFGPLLQTYASVTFPQTLVHLLIQCLGQDLDLPFSTLPTTESPPMGDFHRSSVTITERLFHACMFAELYNQSLPAGNSLLSAFLR